MSENFELPSHLADRLRDLRNNLLAGLVERDVSIRLALLASLAGEHLLLIGPPGTAKSLVARRLQLAFRDATYFERLLTRFTVPEELFGPLSIKGLEEDKYERLTQSYLPTSSIAFLDEIFKANSAILNALLTLLNEREFDNGAKRDKTPLIAVIGASNELPEGEELDALYDRFLLRLHVAPVSKDAFPELLGLRGQAQPETPESLKLVDAELKTIREAAENVEVQSDVVALICDLREWCAAEKLPVSDRRWRKIIKLLQVSALTNGRSWVSIWDCWLLQHCLWNKPEDRSKAYEWYAARVGVSAAMDPSRLTSVVVAWESGLKRDQDSRTQMRDEQGRLLFKDNKGKITPEGKGEKQAANGDDLLYLAPDGSDIKDRTNGGKGFTLQELNELRINQQSGYYSREYFKNWTSRAEYLANENNWLMVNTNWPAHMEPTRHKRVYLNHCLQSLDEIKKDVDNYKENLKEHMASMEAEIRSHLWVTPDFAEPASETLKQTMNEVESLQNRINNARKGFELLPCEDDVPETTRLNPRAADVTKTSGNNKSSTI